MRNETYNNNRKRMEEILRLRRSGATCKEIGGRFGLSTQRVRVIVARAEWEEKRLREEKDPLIREILRMKIHGTMTYHGVNTLRINQYCGDFIELASKGPKILLRAKGSGLTGIAVIARALENMGVINDQDPLWREYRSKRYLDRFVSATEQNDRKT